MQNLESYRSFYIAAKYENFTRAGEELFVTQSSVSQAIKKLEASLGIALFLRKGKKVQLTDEGRVLYRELEGVFATLDNAERMMKEYKRAERGSLHIAASDTLCRHYLIPLLQHYKEHYPHIHLNIYNQPSPQVLEMVQSAEVDLGFINGESGEYPDIQSTPLLSLEERFFISPNFHVPKGILSSKDLLDLPAVSLKKQTSTRQLLESIFRKQRLKFEPEVEVISIDLMIDLVKIGFGVGFTHGPLIEKEGLCPLDVDINLPKRHLLLLTNPSVPPSKASSLFQAHCRQHFTGDAEVSS